MITKSIARASGLAVGAAMVLGFASNAGAVTVAELQAQIAALMAQLSAMQGGASASAAITSDLTVGSTGSQVVALQNALVAQGYLAMPAGVAPGYFGSLTKAAVMKWQAAVGLPATGFFGPLSRAKFTGAVAGGTTTGGTTTTTGTVLTGITTPGVEGTLTVTSAPVSNSTVYEGDSMVSVLAFKAEADLSDVAIQRVKLDLGTDSTLYRDIISRVYLVDDQGRTLASSDLNNNTVVRNGSDEYELTLAGFSSVVAKDTTRTYTIKADIQSSIDSADRTEGGTIALADNGVRAIDGAGIDLYSPANDTTVTKTLTVSADLTESASLIVSKNNASPLAREIVASGGSNEDEADRVVLLVFDIRAEKDAIELTDLSNFSITNTGTGSRATASTTYLYAGNGTGGQLLASATNTNGDADFTNISYTIPANTTRTFTLAVDVRGATSNQATIAASFTGNTTNVEAENSDGDSVDTISGSATGNNLLVRNTGAVITLVGTPTLVKSQTPTVGNTSTSTATATFRVNVAAVGQSVLVGVNGSTTPLASNAGNGVDDDPSFQVFRDGTNVTSSLGVASSTDITNPSGYTVSDSTVTITEGNNAEFVLTYVFKGATDANAAVTFGNYAVGLGQLNWATGTLGLKATDFMSGLTEWRTNSVQLP